MENFLATVRELARDGWTIVLTTCDQRVVTSFRKNMETLPSDFPSAIYTFKEWDQAYGPRIEITRIKSRGTRHLKDLAAETFKAEQVL